MRPSPLSQVLVTLFAMSGPVEAASRVFYDGFESGNVALWKQEDGRNMCTTVTSSIDGVRGPYAGARMARCNWNGTVVWNAPNAYETMTISPSYGQEILYRFRFRIDKDITNEFRVAPDPSPGTPTRPKIFRIFTNSSQGHDYFSAPYDNVFHGGVAAGVGMQTWWGGDQVDGDSAKWHTIEYYFNHQTGMARVWNDGVRTRNDTGFNFGTWRWLPLYITSNWSGPDGCCNHDTTNHIYVDEVEVFSDTNDGTPTIGLMSDATIKAKGAPAAPTGLSVH